MSQVVLLNPENDANQTSLKEDMFRFRHKIFYERMGWEVPSINGMEQDEFDKENPVYVISRNDEHHVEGCWRLLPTTGPNMLRDIFPQLLGDAEVPCSPTEWEISRLAVSPGSQERMSTQLHRITSQMLRTLFDFAEANGIERFVFVTSVTLERLIRRLGFTLHRFSEPQQVGKVMSVACWLDVNSESRQLIDACYGRNTKEALSDDQFR